MSLHATLSFERQQWHSQLDSLHLACKLRLIIIFFIFFFIKTTACNLQLNLTAINHHAFILSCMRCRTELDQPDLNDSINIFVKKQIHYSDVNFG